MRAGARTLLVLAALLTGAWAALASDAPSPDDAPPYSVELQWRPPEHRQHLHVGGVTTLRIDVRTPPEHTLLPIPGDALEGFRLVATIPAPVERDDAVWTHRTFLKLQALAPGEAAWPAMTLRVEDADGHTHEIPTPELRRVVEATAAPHPPRTRPFGLRYPTRHRALPGIAIALGATLLASLLAWAGLRRRAAGADPGRSTAPEGDVRSRAETKLELARALLERDPREASNLGAELLRDFMAERFGASLRAATTAELRASLPSEAARPHWQPFVQLLGRYDADRFQRREGADAPAREQVAQCLDETARFLATCAPRDGETGP